MKTVCKQGCSFLLVTFIIGLVAVGMAQEPSGCKALPNHESLRSALQAAVKGGSQANGGLGNQEWGVIVDRNGIVCAVAYSGENASQEWPGSRMIAADKANTANGSAALTSLSRLPRCIGRRSRAESIWHHYQPTAESAGGVR